MSAALCLPASSAIVSFSSDCPPASIQDLAIQRFRHNYAQRILTSSIYSQHPPSTYSLLLAHNPHFTLAPPHYSHLAPGLAPRSSDLLAYQLGELPWEAFARRYWRDLMALPHLLAEARRQVTRLLDCYHSLTLLGLTHCLPSEEHSIRCIRRLVRAWLLGETPMEVSRA